MSYFDDFEDDYMRRLDSIEESVSHSQREKKKKDKKQIFSRGYQVSRERLAKNPYYTRSCFNCQYFYQASGDREEVCQNESVLEYDMVVSENNVYCVKWTPCTTNDTSMFKKKTGRSRLD